MPSLPLDAADARALHDTIPAAAGNHLRGASSAFPRSAGKHMATKAIDAPRHKGANKVNQRRIRKIFGNIHEISEMPNLIEVQRESYEQFLRSDPKTGYVSGLEKTLRSVFPIRNHRSGRAALASRP